MFQQRLSEIDAKRAKSEPLPTGIAPPTSSDSFKMRKDSHANKAKRWVHIFSTESRRRKPSTLKASSSLLNNSSMIALGTARPTYQYFPWNAITMHQVGTNNSHTNIAPGVSMTYTGGEQGFDLAVALNYGYAAGSPQLLRFVTEHIEMIHNPPYDDWQSCLTTGTTSAMEMAFRILCDRGDWVLFEEYTYSGALDIARTQGLNVLGIRMDEMGLIPEDLDVRLKN